MKSSLKKIVGSITAAILLMPAIVYAQSSAVGQGLDAHLGALFGGGLAADRSLPTLIFDVIQLLLFFAGSVAVLFIIIGGFQYITAGGNEEQAEKGRKALTNAIIGIVIVILAYAIITIVESTLTRL